ncbi:helix-turn-helix domain-containing protein [Rhizorhabdus sp.]|jgi:AraC-like DNA-binding protein|uniref:helix-turn-helix domain-containing protein n=1 Tax=Rhizorhabdus sp. TaxID=1968843 RepID=UPI0019878EB8|nr:helix-turn-helix domain-containing protein [Rhizorhabdus sp.]MBD3760397.1 helix-turn-helix domain-containing protein [Rhizorhabdus sp.]
MNDPPAWLFSTRELPSEARNAAWCDAMRRLRLPVVTPAGPDPMDGSVTVAVSPMGIQFALVEADPLEIAGSSADQIEGLWLSIMLEGSGSICASGFEADFGPGMILCAVTRSPARLTLRERHRQLYVRLPHPAIAHRLLAHLEANVVMIDASHGMGAIFRRLLESTAEELETLDADQLRPVEIAVIEFLVASLAASGGTRARGGADGARAALLHRILQRMEMMLGDPELSIGSLASDAGISPRYLRRLFAAEGMNFAATMKARRLERCHADLTSPLHAQIGISEIAFRWGFNDAAHFSRSFRKRFGISPREHRRGLS